MEHWDAYRADGSLAGSDLVRGNPIPDGLYHLVSDILVRHSNGSILLMQRDLNKVGYPGCYEASAGGSILKAEASLHGALRELDEETGIVVEKLEFIFRQVHKDVHTIYDQYLCITDCEKDSITLQVGETIAYKWVSKAEFLVLIDTDQYPATHHGRIMNHLGNLLSL